jgi:BTB/POZ domain
VPCCLLDISRSICYLETYFSYLKVIVFVDRFLYTDDVGDISHYSVMTTLYAAKKYAVPALQTACVEFLKRNLRADNAFMLVAQVPTLNYPILC